MLSINKENILKCRKKLKGKGIPKFSSPNSIIINMSVTVFPLYFNIVCVGLFLGYTPMTYVVSIIFQPVLFLFYCGKNT